MDLKKETERVNSKSTKDNVSYMNKTPTIKLNPAANTQDLAKKLTAKSFIGAAVGNGKKDKCSDNTTQCRTRFDPKLPENVGEKYGPQKEQCCTKSLKNFRHPNVQLIKVPHDFKNLDKQNFQEIFKSIVSYGPENLNCEIIAQLVDTWLKDLFTERKPAQETFDNVKNALSLCGNHEECHTSDSTMDNNGPFQNHKGDCNCNRSVLRKMHEKLQSNPFPLQDSTVNVNVEPLWHHLSSELFEAIKKLNDSLQKLQDLSEWDWFCITMMAIGMHATFVQKWIIMANRIINLKERNHNQQVVELAKKNSVSVTWEEFQEAQRGGKLRDELNTTIHMYATRFPRGSKYSYGCAHTYQGDMYGLNAYFDFDTKADAEISEVLLNETIEVGKELTSYRWKWRGQLAKISMEFTKLCDKMMHYAVMEAADLLGLKYPVTTPRVDMRCLLSAREKASLLAAYCFANYGFICSDGQDKLHEPGCKCIDERYAGWLYCEVFCNLMEQWDELDEMSCVFLLSEFEAQRVISAIKNITMSGCNSEIVHENGKAIMYSLMENRHNGLELIKRSSAACDEGPCGVTPNEILDSARRVKNEELRQKLSEYALKKGNDAGTPRVDEHQIDVAVFLRIIPKLDLSMKEWEKCCRIGLEVFENTCELINSGEGFEKLEQAVLTELVSGGCSMLENLVANQPTLMTWNS